MKPSIGRIVIYHCDESKKQMNNNDIDAPAIITAVWSEQCVNLKVLLDGPEILWMTSVMMGIGDNEWSWPKIN